MDILACPIDKHYPLELHVFEETEEIAEGVIICPKCSRWYPIREEIPEMLPDELREENDELPFMKKWKQKFPKEILEEANTEGAIVVYTIVDLELTKYLEENCKKSNLNCIDLMTPLIKAISSITNLKPKREAGEAKI